MASNGNHEYKANELFLAQAHLYKIMYGFLNPMSVKWAVDLGIPDIIHKHGQPITLPELVSALEVSQSKVDSVYRLMRLLAHNDFFTVVKKIDTETDTDTGIKLEAYGLTPVSKLLVTGTDHCLSPMVNYVNTPALVGSYNQLSKWTSGDDLTIAETALGSGGYWKFLQQNPTYLKTFNESMESDSRVLRLALRECKSVFEGLNSLVDVGGGTGNTAKIISEAFPQLNCIVLDLPEVVADLKGSNNLSFVGGDMFKSIPQADAVLVKWVLHNWSDEACIKVLKNSKDAISGKGKGGKVIIIDIVINEKQDEHEMTEVKLLLDVLMMSFLNGKERSEKEWKRIIMEAGFTHYKIFPVFGFRSLIELYP